MLPVVILVNSKVSLRCKRNYTSAPNIIHYGINSILAFNRRVTLRLQCPIAKAVISGAFIVFFHLLYVGCSRQLCEYLHHKQRTRLLPTVCQSQRIGHQRESANPSNPASNLRKTVHFCKVNQTRPKNQQGHGKVAAMPCTGEEQIITSVSRLLLGPCLEEHWISLRSHPPYW